ncbi:MAG: DUF3078 domain-containing protein, partial [Bacteroidia bacterium]
MKKFLVLIPFIFSNFAFTQNTKLDSLEIDSLQKELKNAETLKTEAEGKIKTLNESIEKLKPFLAWKKGGFAAINFNQMGFTNWAAGGIDALSVTALGNIYLNYAKDKVAWNNNLDIAYGMIQGKGQELRKNEDKIDFLTKFGYNSPVKNVNYAVLANFKSQFAPSYTYDAQNVKSPMISTFMAPAFILASIGIDYKPKPYFSVYISPATGKFTIVSINDNSIKKAFAVDTLKTVRQEFGALMNIFFQKNIHKNVNLLARLSLFNNYTDVNTSNRKNIDVNFESMINARINRFISASLFVNAIYDHDIQISLDENDLTKVGPRL